MTYQDLTKCLWMGRHRGEPFLVLLLGLLADGCSSDGIISGKVFYQGKPLPGGTVTFFTPDKGAMSCVLTPEGAYMVEKVPVGEVKIAVQLLRPKNAVGSSTVQQMMRQAVKSGKVDREKIPSELKKRFETPKFPTRGQRVQIPLHYADPEKSGLTYTVSGGKQMHDIELK